jgi:hypothetical protein
MDYKTSAKLALPQKQAFIGHEGTKCHENGSPRSFSRCYIQELRFPVSEKRLKRSHFPESLAKRLIQQLTVGGGFMCNKA